ncbi:MgtC/SapB family protein [Leptolyngbya sp. AN02str]|uniref:MgtC/SapB family protein n=1 Tax=Leptolyngbya sp. AN02str TaxID=3423363 RepID=UPI003D320F89
MSYMFVQSDDVLTILFRLGLAMFLGGVIGFNRQRGGRAAGVRTFMIVSLGAAFFVMIPLQAEGENSFAATNALSRTIQGVATGVGFLGAGLILQQSSRKLGIIKVRGLTTAATIWASAGLGAAIGCGLWQMGLIGTGFILLALSGVKRAQKTVKKTVQSSAFILLRSRPLESTHSGNSAPDEPDAKT